MADETNLDIEALERALALGEEALQGPGAARFQNRGVRIIGTA